MNVLKSFFENQIKKNNFLTVQVALSVLPLLFIVLIAGCGGKTKPDNPADVDKTSPVIHLNGASILRLMVGNDFTDPVTATDDVDGDISGSIVITGSVDMQTADTYTIRYNVTDAAGNAAVEVILTVIVSSTLISPNATFEDDFNDVVDESVWQIATWPEHGGATGKERCYVENGNLKMLFINDSTHGYLSSAIQTRNEFLYGRWEARLKPSDVSGVLNSMYTIDWDDGNGTKQEIDIEFLTKSFMTDSGEVHYAVHAEGLQSFNTNPDVMLDFNPSDDFHVWGFEITPEHIQWFVDAQTLLTYTYSENDISIDSSYQLKFNFWSEPGGWVGGPPTADVECIYLIDWIKFYPYIGN